MSFKKYQEWVGRIAYFKKHHVTARLLKEGILCGVITHVIKENKLVFFIISYGPIEEKRTVKLTKKAFTTIPLNGKPNFRPLIGHTVYFNPKNAEGKHFIEQGFATGIIRNISVNAGELRYEISFGTGGHQLYALLGRLAFLFTAPEEKTQIQEEKQPAEKEDDEPH